MTIRLLRARDRPETPWKNGGGVTREIAVFPPGAGLDTFDWRVSMATVTACGPFSIFPGIDRMLAVLEGELRLVFEDGATVDLTPGSAPAAFPGDLPARAETPASPVTDLNVMTRRGRVRARVTRLSFESSEALTAAKTTLVLSLSSEIRVRYAGGECHLERLDAVLIEDAEGLPVDLGGAGSATAFRVDLIRRKDREA